MSENTAATLTLTALADRQALADLLATLGRSLDEHRFDDLDRIFTEDVTGTTPGGTATGRAALVEQARRNHIEYDRLQHQFNTVLIETDGDRGMVRANLLGSFGYAADPKPARQFGAVYRCEAVRTADGWRFSAFEITSVWRIEYTDAPVPVPAGSAS